MCHLKMDVNMKQLCALVLLCSVYGAVYGADRQLSTQFHHYTRNDTGENYTIAHIQAKGEVDDLHYVVTSIGLPTIFVAVTKLDVKLSIDWDTLLSGNTTEMAGSVKLQPEADVLYSYATVFTKLIDYNDTKDSSKMTSYGPDTTEWSVYKLSELVFEDLEAASSANDNMILFKSNENGPVQLWKYGGEFSIKLQAFGTSGREDQLPRLEYNAQIMQFDLNIDHIWTNFSMSRFAVEMVIIGGTNNAMKLDETRSIDDEFAPGVFTISNWLTKPDSTASTGFLQWKPVCYKSLQRARSQATFVRHYDIQPLTPATREDIDRTIAFAIYGNEMDKKMIRAGNFSFGLTDDGFYNKTQVLTWSGSIGYGDPPFDKVSKTVMIIISAGLGLPAVLMIFGGIYVCIKKRSQSEGKPLKPMNSGYQPVET